MEKDSQLSENLENHKCFALYGMHTYTHIYSIILCMCVCTHVMLICAVSLCCIGPKVDTNFLVEPLAYWNLFLMAENDEGQPIV